MKKYLVALGPFLPYIVGGIFLLIGGLYAFKYLQDNFGAGTSDPGGGAPSTGIIDGVLNHTLEIGKSSENYTSAAQQTATDPLGVIESIIGLKQTAAINTNNNAPGGAGGTY